MFVQYWSKMQYLSVERQGFLFHPQSKQEYSYLGKVKWVNEWLKNHVSLVNSQKRNQSYAAGILWKNKNFWRIQKLNTGATKEMGMPMIIRYTEIQFWCCSLGYSLTLFSFVVYVNFTAKNTVISPDFLVWKFCRKSVSA